MNKRIVCLVFLVYVAAWPACRPLYSTSAEENVSGHSAPEIYSADTILLPFPEVTIDTILFEGHRLTRDRTVRRELLFRSGDTLNTKELAKKTVGSRSNLMKTGLFNFVEVTIDESAYPSLVVTYTLIERWNIWPIPILELDEPNLNQWLENPSFSRINYGVNLLVINATGRNERIRLAARAGNVQTLHFLLKTPYWGKKQNLRWELCYSLDRTKRRAYNTERNEQLFVKLADDYAANEHLLASRLTFRPGHNNTHSMAVGYHNHHYADTLLTLNPRFGPDGKNSFSFFSLSYSFQRDRRNIIAYPLDGHLIDGSITRKGLSILSQENMDVTTLEGTIRHYIPLRPKWYAAWSINGKWSEGSTLSYFDQQGLGFSRSLIRGYENYVVDGHKFLVIKSNLKYNLLPERVSELGFIRTKKFSLIHYAIYLNIFADAGIINDRHFNENNNLANKWLAGAGLGLDFHTYYDTVMRTELTLNRHGKAGLFFHLRAPI